MFLHRYSWDTYTHAADTHIHTTRRTDTRMHTHTTTHCTHDTGTLHTTHTHAHTTMHTHLTPHIPHTTHTTFHTHTTSHTPHTLQELLCEDKDDSLQEFPRGKGEDREVTKNGVHHSRETQNNVRFQGSMTGFFHQWEPGAIELGME